jgi:hypothetical protein
VGYANRIITLNFPELSEDQEKDPIRVVIRNPRLMPMGELAAKEADGVTIGEDGEPVVSDGDKATAATLSRMANMIIGWRCYDASAPIELDDEGNITSPQPLLPLPATADLVGRLPMEIISRLGDVIKEAVNPR